MKLTFPMIWEEGGEGYLGEIFRSYTFITHIDLKRLQGI